MTVSYRNSPPRALCVPRDLAIPIFATALADLIVWDRGRYRRIVQYPRGVIRGISAGFGFFRADPAEGPATAFSTSPVPGAACKIFPLFISLLHKSLPLVVPLVYNNNILWLEVMSTRICGLQKLSMVDFPGKLAATVFTGGCDLRCPFCHNAPLVTRAAEQPELPRQEVLDFLQSRQGLLDGVVLSGGEPLLHPGAAEFLREVRDLGFAVKLDTNGCHPSALAGILDRGLVDYVAMDIKNSPEKYPETVGVPNFDLGPVEESVRLLRDSGVDYEFRTTVVQGLHTPADIRAIGRWLEGSPRYFLQRFVDSGDLVGSGCRSPEPEELQALAEAAAPWFQEVALRGVG